MSAGSMNTGRCVTRSARRRSSRAPTRYGIRARSRMQRDGSWTCPTARACSATWPTCSLAKSIGLPAGSLFRRTTSTTFPFATRICTSRRLPIRDRRSAMRARKVSAIQQLIVPAHWQAMSMCPVGNGNSARLPRMVSSSTMKSGRMRSRSRHSGSPKRRSPTPNLPLSSRRAAIDAANSGARRDGNGASARERSIRSTGSITRVTAGRGATTIKSRRSRRMRR